METVGEFFARRLSEAFEFQKALTDSLGMDGTVLMGKNSSGGSGYDIFTTPTTVDRLTSEGYDVAITMRWMETEEVCRAIVIPAYTTNERSS